jgi:hypothetical protein
MPRKPPIDSAPPSEGILLPRDKSAREEPRVHRIPHSRGHRFHPGGFMVGQGSGGNVIAAICSFFVPGLGQLVQGRPLMAIVHFCLASVLWLILMGWIVHLWSILDAAKFKPKN